ncbi:L-lactate permease [Pseudochrobactrum asaccharolyticum]|uniref:L-lactate permease n=1 Tax=Pseudochrobactrum asaccharolyticum TaxID=354351 RepID=A0A366E0V5_9HYPH|nr:L-lactate permease [Pseudochrobactrum asaccharolyticum]MBX8799604.1 L-lactate permease [Ochrobactrum sp. MR28]MBX8815646.1 L-lactate permease [Ochrobactrum sp. MR31]RBO95943.1 lactate permease [Pseudochrobactrum asaccharolyticum]
MSLNLDLLHWILAAIPIIALIILMVGMNWTAQQAGTTGIFIAAGIAVFAFEASTRALAVASARGIWDAMPILYVIWPALLLYQIMNQSGGYDALRRGISRMSRNELFIIVALGWVFTSFLQGIDGFGTPIAVVAPLLVAFGMRPVYAVAIPIIAHIWAKFYGTLGVGWLATLQVVEMDAGTTLSMGLQAAILIAIQSVLGGFMVVWMYGRGAAVRAGWPLVLVIAAIHSIGQFLVVFIDPILAAFLPAALAMVALYPLSQWSRYKEADTTIIDRPAMREEAHMEENSAEPPMDIVAAFSPYALLTILALATSLIDRLHAWLYIPSFGLPFPAITTGMGVETAASDSYSPLHMFAHPGATITVTALVTWFCFRKFDYFNQWAKATGKEMPGVVKGLFASAVPASVPIIAFLVMASIMKLSGQNTMLALGIAAIAPAYVFAFLANGIGILGAFITSSSTSSQVLFSELQVNLAEAKGLPPSTILAAQSAGGAIGNAIAPANVVMGASTTGINGQEGAILRKTIPWTIAAFVLTGIATVIMSMIFA